MSGAHCRICLFFEGNDARGPLYAVKGRCPKIAAPLVAPVLPEFCCPKFLMNEALRDG
jgi:hypothetical protein